MVQSKSSLFVHLSPKNSFIFSFSFFIYLCKRLYKKISKVILYFCFEKYFTINTFSAKAKYCSYPALYSQPTKLPSYQVVNCHSSSVIHVIEFIGQDVS